MKDYDSSVDEMNEYYLDNVITRDGLIFKVDKEKKTLEALAIANASKFCAEIAFVSDRFWGRHSFSGCSTQARAFSTGFAMTRSRGPRKATHQDGMRTANSQRGDRQWSPECHRFVSRHPRS
jgi:hypothetical protein